jgi:hypothetical protein
MIKVPKKIIVDIDGNETKPLEFPSSLFWWDPYRRSHLIRVETVKRRIPSGDYAIRGYERLCLVERKGSSSELVTNLFTQDRYRFTQAWTRFVKATKHPILLLDMPLTMKRNEYCREPDQVLDALFGLVAVDGVHIVWMPPCSNPKRTGDRLLRLMWQCIYYQQMKRSKPRGKAKAKEEGAKS